MSKDTVICYWIEKGSDALETRPMGPADLRRGSTYKHEIDVKYARDPVDVVVILIASVGEEASKAQIERLKAKAAEIRQAMAMQEPKP